jgi:hypothetical protein
MREVVDIKQLLNIAKYAKREVLENLSSENDFMVHLRSDTNKDQQMEQIICK